MLKRTIAVIMGLILILSLVPSAVAQTGGTHFEIVTVDETCIATNITVDVLIHGNSTEGISGAVLQLEFDDAVFSLIGAEKGALCAENDSVTVVWDEDMTAIAFVSPQATYGDGALLRLTFRTKDEVVAGDYAIKVSQIELEDGNLNDLTAADGEKTVKVFDYLWGDASGNKETNLEDVMAILRWKVGILQDADLDLTAADTDCTGGVALTDAILLLQWLAGYVEWAPCGYITTSNTQSV